MTPPDDLLARASELELIGHQIHELADRAGELVRGTPAYADARRWLRHLDRATGTEAGETIEDTCERLRRLAAGAERETVAA